MAALLNLRVWAGLALAVVLAFTHFFVYRSGKAVVRNEFDAYKLTAAQKLADAERKQREIEAQWAVAVQEVQDHAQSQINALEGQLSDARRASDGLRAAAASAARRACPRAALADAGTGHAGQDSLDLLVDVLARADAAAGEVGEYADRLRVAGAACERAYDALKVTK